jgi:hypothetical protein
METAKPCTFCRPNLPCMTHSPGFTQEQAEAWIKHREEVARYRARERAKIPGVVGGPYEVRYPQS